MSEKKLKSIVVDDSEMQRTSVAKLIKDHQNLELVAEYRNGVEVLQNVKSNEIDVIFLDVEMPLVNGFDLLKSMKHTPQVVLISSDPSHALKAFDFNVTDYLLKPITPPRFNTAVKKALVASSYRKNNVIDDDRHIFVKSNLQRIKVKLTDIKWVEALGDYVKLFLEDATILVLTSMKSFSEKLPANEFLRIHKSYIINLNKVEKFNSNSVELCGEILPLSRKRKMELKEALGEA
ncbi:response regulator transcription factor [Aurantibacter crassamenti]|uniref:LytR/AlgR family response regulator transcription factor n=1 Tax=Aurantibacter crassamenti TaxID=1837375 RepID=UPI0019392CD8|nr:LytTR family DNA-binding domain-containing protein [Aurantibacter crassamenti]MBM1107692.1 response regulator transcription factor [Aurantibacter crassamenti]